MFDNIVINHNELLIKNECLILDYNDSKLKLHIKINPIFILNNRVYKLRLKRYIDNNTNAIENNLLEPVFTSQEDIDLILRDLKLL